MTAAQMDALFRPFVQADSSTTRKFGGTGLGLTISKRLAEMLGGDITVRSESGAGTTFSAYISPGNIQNVPMLESPPIVVSAPVEQAPAVNDHALKLRGRVLLAEDGVDNQALIEFYLNELGLQVTTVANGRLARDSALRASQDGRPFDLVLMDMQMPELDGYEATGQLRAAGYDRPIIALTAHAMESDREKCLAAGCNDFVTKPIDRSAFRATLERNLANIPSTPEPHEPRDALAELLAKPRMAQLVDRFVRGLDQRVQSLRDAIAADDQQQLKVLAHQLKGAAGGYGFPEISRAAAGFEAAVNEHDLQSLQAQLDQLISLCDVAKQRAPVLAPQVA
jgi:CheY-like chemotaxis protein